VKIVWPRWKEWLIKKFGPANFSRLVDEFESIGKVDPAKGLPYLLEVARIHDQASKPSFNPDGTVTEQAGREAILRLKGSAADNGLVALSISDLERGYFESGMRTLNAFFARRSGSTELTALANEVKQALEKKEALENRMRRLKAKRIFWKVLATAGAVSAGAYAISYFRVDPPLLAALKSVAMTIASSIGMWRVFHYIWLNYGTEELRRQVAGEIHELTDIFRHLLQTHPTYALPYLESLAVPDKRTDVFIQDAALDALLSSPHPLVLDSLQRLGIANINIQGNLGFTRKVLTATIERRIQCAKILVSFAIGVWKKN
jgi:hypothetical protein